MTHLYKAAVEAAIIKYSYFKLHSRYIAGKDVFVCAVTIQRNIGVTTVGWFAIANFIAANFVKLQKGAILALIGMAPDYSNGLKGNAAGAAAGLGAGATAGIGT